MDQSDERSITNIKLVRSREGNLYTAIHLVPDPPQV